jgi:cytochrome P450
MSAPSQPGCPVLDITARAAHQEAAVLRERAPAVLVELPGGIRAWSVTRHSVMLAMLRDPRISRDFRQHWSRRDVPEDWVLAPIAFQNNFVNAYGEAHRRARRRLAPSFIPRRVELLRPRVQATADQLVDALAATPPGQRVDLRARLSLPLTMTVICDLFGVPTDMREDIGTAMDAVIDTSVDADQGGAVVAAIHAQLSRLIAHKRAHPGPDLASDLLRSNQGAQPMDEPELIATFFVMIGAGYETTVNLIASAALALLTHPRYRALAASGALPWADVVEETLRQQGPVMHLPLRYAVEDYPVGEGVVIPKGDPIILAFAAAGRDPAAHPDRPDEFDPTRADKGHLAFGDGPHTCLGAGLARLEAAIALSTLFGRLPDLALAEPERRPEPMASLLVNGPSWVEVIPTPAG